MARWDGEGVLGARGGTRARWLALTTVLLVAACGGEEPAAPSGASMAGASSAAREGSSKRGSLPVIESGRLEPASPRGGQAVRALVVTRDADGDAVTVSYAWRVNGSSLPVDGAEILVPGVEKGARIEVEAVARDGSGRSAPLLLTGNVGNQPPELVAVGIQPEGEVSRGKPLTAVPAASDADGDALSFAYTWTVNGEKVAATGETLDTSKLKRGDKVRLRVVANDGEDDSNAIESPELKVANASPVIRSTPPSFEGDGSYRYSLDAVDPDGDRSLRYRLAHAPDGMAIDPLGGVIQWRPTAKNTGKHTIEVVVDDLQGGTTSQIFELTVALQEPEPSAEATAEKKPARSKVASRAVKGSSEGDEEDGAPLDADEAEASGDE